jgi:hypothetical protein
MQKRAGLSTTKKQPANARRNNGRKQRSVSKPFATRTVIKHKEMIGSVSPTTTDFAPLGFSSLRSNCMINPANEAMFPWLSNIATSFDRYIIRKLQFIIKSGNPTTASGRIYACIDSDPDDVLPTTSVQVTNMAYSKTAGVYSDLIVPHPYIGKEFFVSATVKANGFEPRLMHNGFFCLYSHSDTSNVWDVWVDYEIELRYPQIPHLEVSVDSADLGIAYGAGTDAYTPVHFVGSKLPVVTTGNSGVPIIEDTGMGLLSQVFDASRMAGGMLTLAPIVEALAAHAPDEMVPYLKLFMRVYNSEGSELGVAKLSDTGNPADTHILFTPRSVTNWATPNKEVVGLGRFSISQLFTDFPAARYLAAGLAVYANGLVGSTTGNKVIANLEL